MMLQYSYTVTYILTLRYGTSLRATSCERHWHDVLNILRLCYLTSYERCLLDIANSL